MDVSDATKEKERGEKYSVPNQVVAVLEKTQTLTVAPGKSAEYVLNEKLAPEVKSGDLWVEVKQGDRQVYRYWTLFKVGWANGFLAPVQQPDPTKFDFSLAFNPVRSWVLVKGDTYALPDPKLGQALVYTITREGDTKPTAEGRITQCAEYYLQELLKLPPLTAREIQRLGSHGTDRRQSARPHGRRFREEGRGQGVSPLVGQEVRQYRARPAAFRGDHEVRSRRSEA